MSNLKKYLPLLLVFTVFCLGLSPVQGSAQTLDTNNTTPTDEEVQVLADELEYLFTNILVKDDNTGEYILNEEELKNSTYTDEEKAQLRAVTNQFMTFGVFDRCMQDLLGIGAAAWAEIKGLIDAKQYLSAAGAIAIAGGIAVSPITLAVFVLTCGPSSAG
ncbi:hypothetical protein KQI46_15725 [Lysinibacillus capsici]|uniref:hypothetical protein n=1 Tax=Lysinibacillus capsici TaxID=2115968 RepID=UPI001C105C48|nr:hypothetical protein [Lysinibacillus capsici]MBU5253336.1 hypothetical protein [Lysinibacillus capsici]